MKAHFVRITALVSALLFASGPTQSQTNQSPSPVSLPDIIDRVSSAIVQVQMEISFQTQSAIAGNTDSVPPVSQFVTSSGTGFFIDGEGYVATARHVIDIDGITSELAVKASQAQLRIVDGSIKITSIRVSRTEPASRDFSGNVYVGNGRSTDATTYREDQLYDIAILKVDPQALKDSPPIHFPNWIVPEFDQNDAVRPGTPISTTGYPAIGNFNKGFNTGHGSPGLSSLTTNTGTVANSFLVDEQHRSLFLIDLHANHGNSGGPVFRDSNGKIIGFVDAYLNSTDNQNSGLTVVIPIERVFSLLRRQ
jgi:S1-C subfamily serine protease